MGSIPGSVFDYVREQRHILWISLTPVIAVTYGTSFSEWVLRMIRSRPQGLRGGWRGPTARAAGYTQGQPVRRNPRQLERRVAVRVHGDKMAMSVLASLIGLAFVPYGRRVLNISPDTLLLFVAILGALIVVVTVQIRLMAGTTGARHDWWRDSLVNMLGIAAACCGVMLMIYGFVNIREG